VVLVAVVLHEEAAEALADVDGAHRGVEEASVTVAEEVARAADPDLVEAGEAAASRGEGRVAVDVEVVALADVDGVIRSRGGFVDLQG
jgi:hypothetical protein